jgi:TetR/AcrR family transcriptional repressor of lmrAB and yxaGH operons
MVGDVRARMIESAVQLLAAHGLQGASFAEVLDRARAPRGSVYHHFPGGKDELVDAALDLAAARLHDLLGQLAGASAERVTETFLLLWQAVLTRSQFRAGCAVLAVTVATDSRVQLTHASAIFRAWRAQLAELLEGGGLTARQAARFAATLVAASEGAVVMSRAEQSLEPFEFVCEQLLDEVRRMQGLITGE